MIMHKALYSRDDLTERMCQEKKEEEFGPVFKIHRYNDYKTS